MQHAAGKILPRHVHFRQFAERRIDQTVAGECPDARFRKTHGAGQQQAARAKDDQTGLRRRPRRGLEHDPVYRVQPHADPPGVGRSHAVRLQRCHDQTRHIARLTGHVFHAIGLPRQDIAVGQFHVRPVPLRREPLSRSTRTGLPVCVSWRPSKSSGFRGS